MRTEWTTGNGTLISDQDIYWFTDGGCYLMAEAINSLTGWPMLAFESSWLDGVPDEHAFVHIPGTDLFLDVEGLHTESQLRKRWGQGSEIIEVSSYPWVLPPWWDVTEFEVRERARELAPALVEVANAVLRDLPRAQAA